MDYAAFDEGRRAIERITHPIRAAVGAFVGATALLAASTPWLHRFSSRGFAKNGEGPAGSAFLPKQGFDEILTRPGPPGMMQTLDPGLHPVHCLFLYGDMAKETTNNLFTSDKFLKGGESVKGWMYGAELMPGHALATPTADPIDVLKGTLVCWPSDISDKLKLADSFWEKKAVRAVASVVKRDGNSEKAYWYFETKLPSPPPAPAAPAVKASKDSASLMGKRAQTAPKDALAITVVGASGHMSVSKTLPALFSLFYHGLMPPHFLIVGFSRSAMTEQEFRDQIMGSLTCRVLDGERCSRKMSEFLPHCTYVQGQYDSRLDFKNVSRVIGEFEHSHAVSNRMFYMAVPTSVVEAVAAPIASAARARKGWTRIIIEKPFGRDLDSYKRLQATLSNAFAEDEIYRIDHYLGKELVQNLMTLRFANSVWEPLWSRRYIQSVQIVFKEPTGVEGRRVVRWSGKPGAFDEIGIVRDIMQNHLLAVLALIGMEVPVSLQAEDIRNEKLKLLRNIEPLSADDFVLGQYKGKDKDHPAYIDGEGVPKGSRTPTFAACVFNIKNRRWDGVPFLMKAGNALDENKAEIRIQFKPTPGNIFNVPASIAGNQLVFRVQPDEAIYLKIASKAPGLTSRLEQARLDLFLRESWNKENSDIPDAYERLILDVMHGEKSLFMRNDELEVAWSIFDRAIHEMEDPRAPRPEQYNYGSRGPLEADFLAFKRGVKWLED
eukprot:g9229.t1